MFCFTSNGCRKIKPSIYGLVPYKPHFHYAVLAHDRALFSPKNEGFTAHSIAQSKQELPLFPCCYPIQQLEQMWKLCTDKERR